MKREVIVAAAVSTAVVVFGSVLVLASIPARAEGAMPATPVAPAASVQVSPQDTGNINQICSLALEARVDGKELNLQTKTQIGQYCLDLLGRIAAAEKAGAQAASSAPSAPVPAPAPAPKEPHK